MPATRLGVCAGPSAVEASDSLYSSIPIHLSTHAQSEKERGGTIPRSFTLTTLFALRGLSTRRPQCWRRRRRDLNGGSFPRRCPRRRRRRGRALQATIEPRKKGVGVLLKGRSLHNEMVIYSSGDALLVIGFSSVRQLAYRIHTTVDRE